MNSFTIDEIERAINIWRARQGSDNSAALCRPARVLAEPYARLIMSRGTAIDAADLSDEQRVALDDALKPRA
jgi:hypothetical protein